MDGNDKTSREGCPTLEEIIAELDAEITPVLDDLDGLPDFDLELPDLHLDGLDDWWR